MKHAVQVTSPKQPSTYVRLRSLNHNLSNYIKQVAAGKQLVIQRRQQPIAAIIPIADFEKLQAVSSEQQLDQLYDAFDMFTGAGSHPEITDLSQRIDTVLYDEPYSAADQEERA